MLHVSNSMSNNSNINVASCNKMSLLKVNCPRLFWIDCRVIVIVPIPHNQQPSQWQCDKSVRKSNYKPWQFDPKAVTELLLTAVC